MISSCEGGKVNFLFFKTRACPCNYTGHVVQMGSAEVIKAIVSRTFEENVAFIEQDPEHEYLYHVKIGFVPNMKVRNQKHIYIRLCICFFYLF